MTFTVKKLKEKSIKPGRLLLFIDSVHFLK